MGKRFTIRFDTNPRHWEIPPDVQEEYAGLVVEGEAYGGGNCLVKISSIVAALEARDPDSKAAQWFKANVPSWDKLNSLFGPEEYVRV